MVSLIEEIKKDLDYKNQFLIDRLCFLIDVKKIIHKAYSDNDLKQGDQTLTAPDLMQICDYLKSASEQKENLDYKIVNSLLKIQSGEIVWPEKFVFSEDVASFLYKALNDLQLPKIKNKSALCNIGSWVNAVSVSPGQAIKKMDFTFVKWNETLGKAYSFALMSQNILPTSVIKVRPTQSWKRRVLGLLPIMFQKFVFIKLKPGLLNTVSVKGSLNIFNEDHCLHKVYGDRLVIKNSMVVNASNINEHKIVDAMKKGNGSALLFSGGGLVRQNTFEQVNKKFIHMHPGKLPEVRGADGFFWSVLLNGYPSCSAFYQNVGIDTGGVIHEESFELPMFNTLLISELESHAKSNFYDVVYRSILDYYDPMMRAITLSDVLEKVNAGSSIDDLELRSQKEIEGRNYHFMHPSLRNKLIELILNNREKV
ncbi:hypothetical protein [Thiosulfativibrio zosterae]|uniref:Formyl transferase N-terminal domain-containing protein n=1 Tax=Thiosulfativibrio zosterae TaxID=2675053 RepID=A0A6F8PM82_9GAMM|nr:hypothetical protein [Thiosulfativibrio zosterae]BBP43110.1 hypothetical protein THMIRHAT_08560 [Thiosulfativibrio zosterae]